MCVPGHCNIFQSMYIMSYDIEDGLCLVVRVPS
jgi:hypothetical protein